MKWILSQIYPSLIAADIMIDSKINELIFEEIKTKVIQIAVDEIIKKYGY